MAGDGKEHPRMIFQPRLKFHPSNTASETQPWSPLRYYAMHSIVGFLIIIIIIIIIVITLLLLLLLLLKQIVPYIV